MSTPFENLRTTLSKNRAHEFERDNWKQFVVPPYFSKLDLNSARKPRILIGGRGCGKTMLLRYFAHESMFSPQRTDIGGEAISQIGLYWRTDTQFCNAMGERGISTEVWISAFGHYLALTLTHEFLLSLESLASSSAKVISLEQAQEFDFSRLRAFDPTLPVSHRDLKEELNARLWTFETWVNNVRKAPEPLFLPGVQFLQAAIEVVKNSPTSAFASIGCYVYIDEYENLRHYQQRVINTCLKHSEPPLVFHVAMKRHAFKDRSTVGEESVSDVHDFRLHDLETYLLEDEETFPVFAAEILLLSLSESGFPVPINTALLRDPQGLESRRSSQYTQRVKQYAESLFPGLSSEQMAEGVFMDPTLLNLLDNKISRALKRRGSRLESKRFVRRHHKQASIIVPALLNRPRLEPNDVLSELDALEHGHPNKFSGRTDWTHNYFVGCYLQLYAPFLRICPLYAGFPTFVSLSRGNLRHFLELCYKSLTRASAEISLSNPQVDYKKQAEAARQASAMFLGEVRSFGRKGEQLYIFALRLGALFNLSHSRPTQSEPEQNHFSVTRGNIELTPEDAMLMTEAQKWAVLFEEPATKHKDPTRPDTVEYILNPIYAPYFYLSYRKRRKLEISTDQLVCLLRGSLDAYAGLMKTYKRRWDIEDAESSPVALSLFAEE